MASWVWLVGCGAGDEQVDTGRVDASVTGDSGTVSVAVDGDGDGFPSDVDCDDTTADVHPGAPEVCDGVVVDCDRLSDDGLVGLDGVWSADLGVAVAAAAEGSELVLCGGTYPGSFELPVAVRVRSYDPASPATLDGDGDTTLALPGGSSLTDVVVTGGHGDTGGGVRLTSPGTLTLERVTVAGNRATYGGGVWLGEGSTLDLVDSVIEGNVAEIGGGGLAVGLGSTATLSGTAVVRDNEADAFGGGVWLDGAALTGGAVSANRVGDGATVSYESGVYAAYDHAAVGGGGVAMTGVSTLTGTEIADNSGDGGGVAVTGGEGWLVAVDVHDNRADYYGGGAWVIEGTLQLDPASTLRDNTAVIGGGAAVMGGALVGGTVDGNTAIAGGGVAVEYVGGTVTDAVISRNDADDVGGGVSMSGATTLERVSVVDNTAGYAGGGCATHAAWIAGNTMSIVDSAVSDNQATGSGGGVAVVADEAEIALALVDTTVSDNFAELAGGLQVDVGVVTIDGGAVVRNEALAQGGGARLDGNGRLQVTNADFGAGSDDNVDDDVWADASYRFGAAASFSCTADLCEP